jgi:hypothetical protein
MLIKKTRLDSFEDKYNDKKTDLSLEDKTEYEKLISDIKGNNDEKSLCCLIEKCPEFGGVYKTCKFYEFKDFIEKEYILNN